MQTFFELLSSRRKSISPFLLLALLSLLTGCFDIGGNYDQPAYRPQDSSQVVAKVSLDKQMIYVMEGKKALLVTACCVGIPNKPTPRGNFQVTRKERNKRSGSYGFSVTHNEIKPVKAEDAKGRYIGYPMAYWVEFAPGYGFHQGCVWPVPRSHGCIRIHPNDACKFYEIMKEGTAIKIAKTQPEDMTLGAHFKRPADYADPDPPSDFLISQEFFNKIKKAVFQESK